jgi:outer membrane lipoprotein-sorting protein
MGEPSIITLVKGTLESMAYAKRKLALCISTAIILMGGATTVVLSSGLAGETLPPADIIKRAQAKYASLTNYSDEGKSIATVDGITITTLFTIRLAQTNLYRIEWQQNSESAFSSIKTKAQAVWSAGEGDFLELGSGAIRQASQAMALAGATGISGGAAATIPGIFFKLNWGNQFGDSVLSEKQQADEKVGDVDCYVFTSDSKGPTRTLWIGRQDFLIHQVRTVTSAEAMKTVLAEAAKRNPEMSDLLHRFEPQDRTSTETHGNIMVNQQFSNEDFVP